MPPIQLFSPCCSAGAGQLGDANTEYPCGPGGDCPNPGPRPDDQAACMYKDTETGRKCQCVFVGYIPDRIKEGWMFKYVLARVDKPGREIQLLIASLLPTTPDQLEELLRPKRSKLPPWISKIIGGGGNDDPLPDHPPAFPYNCEDLLYHPGGWGTPQGSDRFCRMFQPTPKVWNPADPCLKRAAKAYWDAIDKVNKYYQDAHMQTARKLNDNLLRIEGERLLCRAGCDPQWPTACAAACDETAETKKRNWNNWYAEEEERLTREQEKYWKGHERAFWAAASACGYSAGSLEGGAPDWGGPVPIMREEAQA